jgi:hypothetical protein
VLRYIVYPFLNWLAVFVLNAWVIPSKVLAIYCKFNHIRVENLKVAEHLCNIPMMLVHPNLCVEERLFETFGRVLTVNINVISQKVSSPSIPDLIT